MGWGRSPEKDENGRTRHRGGHLKESGAKRDSDFEFRQVPPGINGARFSDQGGQRSHGVESGTDREIPRIEAQ